MAAGVADQRRRPVRPGVPQFRDLVGVEVPAANRSPRALAHGLANEGGVDGTYRLLKNVMGPRLAQRCREALRRAAPCLCADVPGDWREEVIARTRDEKELRIFTTTIPTEHRTYTLIQDPVYRLGLAWRNVSYNQPAHTGFYLGHGMTLPPPKPRITTPKP